MSFSLSWLRQRRRSREARGVDVEVDPCVGRGAELDVPGEGEDAVGAEGDSGRLATGSVSWSSRKLGASRRAVPAVESGSDLNAVRAGGREALPDHNEVAVAVHRDLRNEVLLDPVLVHPKLRSYLLSRRREALPENRAEQTARKACLPDDDEVTRRVRGHRGAFLGSAKCCVDDEL